MNVEEAMDLSAGEDENDEPAEPGTSTAVASAMTPADPRLRVRATAAINLMPPWLPSRLRRCRLRRKGGRCLDCRISYDGCVVTFSLVSENMNFPTVNY